MAVGVSFLVLCLVASWVDASSSSSTVTPILRSRQLEDMNEEQGQEQADVYEANYGGIEPFTGPQITFQGCRNDKARFVVCPASSSNDVATCSARCRGGDEYTSSVLYFARNFGAALQREQYVRCQTAAMYCGDNAGSCYATYGCWSDNQYDAGNNNGDQEEGGGESNDENNDGNNNQQVQAGQNRKHYSCTAYGQYYVGPYCSGNKIYQGLFMDSSCTAIVAEGTFESLFGGTKLVASKETGTPLVQRSACAACSVSVANNNNGNNNNNENQDQEGNEDEENNNNNYDQYNFEQQQSGLPSGCTALAYSGEYITPVKGLALDAFFGSTPGFIFMAVVAGMVFVGIVGWALTVVNGSGRRAKSIAPPLIESNSSEE